MGLGLSPELRTASSVQLVNSTSREIAAAVRAPLASTAPTPEPVQQLVLRVIRASTQEQPRRLALRVSQASTALLKQTPAQRAHLGRSQTR